jgi:hypothetical protein
MSRKKSKNNRSKHNSRHDTFKKNIKNNNIDESTINFERMSKLHRGANLGLETIQSTLATASSWFALSWIAPLLYSGKVAEETSNNLNLNNSNNSTNSTNSNIYNVGYGVRMAQEPETPGYIPPAVSDIMFATMIQFSATFSSLIYGSISGFLKSYNPSFVKDDKLTETLSDSTKYKALTEKIPHYFTDPSLWELKDDIIKATGLSSSLRNKDSKFPNLIGNNLNSGIKSSPQEGSYLSYLKTALYNSVGFGLNKGVREFVEDFGGGLASYPNEGVESEMQKNLTVAALASLSTTLFTPIQSYNNNDINKVNNLALKNYTDFSFKDIIESAKSYFFNVPGRIFGRVVAQVILRESGLNEVDSKLAVAAGEGARNGIGQQGGIFATKNLINYLASQPSTTGTNFNNLKTTLRKIKNNKQQINGEINTDINKLASELSKKFASKDESTEKLDEYKFHRNIVIGMINVKCEIDALYSSINKIDFEQARSKKDKKRFLNLINNYENLSAHYCGILNFYNIMQSRTKFVDNSNDQSVNNDINSNIPGSSLELSNMNSSTQSQTRIDTISETSGNPRAQSSRSKQYKKQYMDNFNRIQRPDTDHVTSL